MPSPQTSPQIDGSPLQLQPDSVWQLASQPTPGVVPESSQVSLMVTMPSPQTSPQIEGSPLQLQPESRWQQASQPTPEEVPEWTQG